jgi:hypothetical protein
VDWRAFVERAAERYADGRARLPDEPDARQRQLTRMGNAAGAAGIASLMLGDRVAADEWLARAADRYRDSWTDAPPGSWGRPIGAIKARILARDWDRAKADAHWALETGAGESDSPISRYAAALACLVLEDWPSARTHAEEARTHEAFPAAVADALAFIAAEDVVGYTEAVEAVLDSFETRDEFLEDLPVADTVMVLQALAGRRGMEATLASEMLPGAASGAG